MNHPAKPTPLAPLEPRDEPVWLALLAAADNRLRVEMPDRGIALAIIGEPLALSPAEVEAALDRIAATGRIERDPGGLRVCVERVVEPARPYGSLPRSKVWTDPDPTVRFAWCTLLVFCDGEGIVAMPFDELAKRACVGRAAFDAALESFVTDGRVERRTDGTLRLVHHARYRDIHPRPEAAHSEETPDGSTQKGTRETSRGD